MIKKAVIPSAGLGTRMLPLTKTQPKEMMPIASKPCIQYIVEELASVGVEQVLIITGQKKRAIEDHFDKDNELNNMLQRSEQQALLQTLEYEDMNVQFFYTRQSRPAGLGDAINHARNFINNEPFIIALGDSIIHSEENQCLLQRMINTYTEHDNSLILGTREVPLEEVSRYGIVKPKGGTDQPVVEIDDVVEKPPVKTTPSRLAFAARYILPPTIFDALDRTSPGKGGELQLTDGIRLLLKEGTLGYSVKLTDKETQWRAIAEAGINLLLSIVLMQFWGIYGILMGTVASFAYRTTDIILYSNKYILHQSPKRTLVRSLRAIVVVLSSFVLFNEFLSINIFSWSNWIIMSTIVGMFAVVFSLVINCLCEWEEAQEVFLLLRSVLQSTGFRA
jgi:UTP--glucose-1-phosphate uridylyltransferase